MKAPAWSIARPRQPKSSAIVLASAISCAERYFTLDSTSKPSIAFEGEASLSYSADRTLIATCEYYVAPCG